MKKSRLLASLLALAVIFTMTLGISAFAAEDTEIPDEDLVTTTAAVDDSAAPADDSNDVASAPVTFSEIGNKMRSYSISNPSLKFKLPSDYNCVTLESSGDDIAAFGVSKADFISYGYLAYGATSDSSSFFYLSRIQDEYSKLIGNYNSLSKIELNEVVSEMSQAIDQSTYTAAYDSTESVKINGQTFIKTTAKNNTETSEVNVVEYNTVHDGYTYTISYIYPVSISEESAKNFEGSIDSFKFSFSFDLKTILPYVAFVLGLAALALSIILFVKYSELKNSLPARETDEADENTSDEDEENYYGFNEEEKAETDEEEASPEEIIEEVAEEVAEEVSESEE